MLCRQTLHFLVWGIRMEISLVRFCSLLLCFEIIAITFAVWCIYLLSPQRRAEDPVWLRLHEFALRYRLGITSLLLFVLVPLQLWINVILQQQDHGVFHPCRSFSMFAPNRHQPSIFTRAVCFHPQKFHGASQCLFSLSY